MSTSRAGADRPEPEFLTQTLRLQRHHPEHVFSYADADARAIRDGDESPVVEDDFRLDDVFVKIAARLGRIARKRDTGRGLQVDVHGATDPRLVHSARPDRDSVLRGEADDSQRLEQPANPSL